MKESKFFSEHSVSCHIVRDHVYTALYTNIQHTCHKQIKCDAQTTTSIIEGKYYLSSTENKNIQR